MASKKGVDFLKAIAENVLKGNSFESVLQKLKITGGGDGRCMAELKLEPHHINLHGGVHGGVLATLVDNTTTYALMSKPANPGVSVDMQVMFLKAAKLGDDLVVDANTIRTDGKLAYIECEIRSKKDGSLVAKGSQTKYLDYRE